MARPTVTGHAALGYLLAVVGVGVAFAIRRALDGVLGVLQPFTLFFVPILFATWVGGGRPGLVALVCGGIVADYWFVEPRNSLGISTIDDLVAATIYAAVGLLVVYVIEWMRRTEEALKRAGIAAEFAAGIERSAREVAEAANRAKDAFLAIVSHELRAPLSPILVSSRMLLSRELDVEQRSRALEVIERSAKSQARLIEDLLDVSRIVAGQMRLEIRPVDLVPVIQAAFEIVRPAAEGKGVRIQMLLAGQIGAISGDAERLQQVVWNLLSNAVKFTPQGGYVQVVLRRLNSHVEIMVTDTGTGISAAFLPHVFERFEQAGREPSARSGLGLGLAIVRHLVELHGGTVRAESPGEGKGAVFTVTLPLIPTNRMAGKATPVQASTPKAQDAVPSPG